MKNLQRTAFLEDGNPDTLLPILRRLNAIHQAMEPDTGVHHQGIEAALVDEVHLHNLHLSLANTITVFSKSSDAAFRCIARPNVLFYSQIRSLIPEHITQILRTEPRLVLLICSGSYRSELRILKKSHLYSLLLIDFLLVSHLLTSLHTLLGRAGILAILCLLNL